jgi:hypothetical protein
MTIFRGWAAEATRVKFQIGNERIELVVERGPVTVACSLARAHRACP